MATSVADAMYSIQEVPGKGKGLIALRKIPKGTRILSEEPVITILASESITPTLRESIMRQVDALNEEQRQTLLSMRKIYPYSSDSERYLDIIRTNGLPYDEDKRAIVFDTCRINHACDNNGHRSWNKNIKRHTVHALRDIEEGEEITICYLAQHRNRQSRQEALQRRSCFTCCCRLCSLPPDKSQESDRRLDKICGLGDLIDRACLQGFLSSPLQILRYVDQQVSLYNEDIPVDDGLPSALLHAANISIVNGDLARGRMFMERSARLWTVCEGDDSKIALDSEACARDPTIPTLYGVSKKWETSMDYVPEGLARSELEDWLWRRGQLTARRPGQLADLRLRDTFPGFIDLPHESNLEPNFYEDSNGITLRPRRHWAFLAEIVEISALVRLQMDIKDVYDDTCQLPFHTDGRGSEVPASQVQKGYTVAILYPRRHHFTSSRHGIRQEDPSMAKIFPASLNQLMILSDLVQEFSRELDGLRTCHSCGKKGASLKQCGKCFMLYYCDKTCQMSSWNEKGHKTDCKLLRDADLRGLFHLNWESFEDYVHFPLDARRG